MGYAINYVLSSLTDVGGYGSSLQTINCLPINGLLLTVLWSIVIETTLADVAEASNDQAKHNRSCNSMFMSFTFEMSQWNL